MADSSYFEFVTGDVQMEIGAFKAALKMADAELKKIAASPDVDEKGPGFEAAGDALIGAGYDGMNKYIRDVAAMSLEEVPRDTEVLANSFKVLDPIASDNYIRVTMGYGFGDEINPKTKRLAGQYALPVHEIYEAKHDPPTKDHYLLDPMIEHSYHLQQDMAAEMRGVKVTGYRINRGVSLFRKGGGPGINPVLDPSGKIVKRKRR